jgi:hypothetical protein
MWGRTEYLLLWYNKNHTVNGASKNVHCHRNVFTKFLPVTIGGYTDPQTHRHVFPNISSVVTCICLLSRCLATIKAHRLMGRIYEVYRWDGLRCHDISFIKTGSGIGGGFRHKMHGDYISLLQCFQSKESRLKISSGIKFLLLGGCGGPNMVFSDVWLLSLTDPVWTWQKVSVRNPQWGATHMWCHPACKVLGFISLFRIHTVTAWINLNYCS